MSTDRRPPELDPVNTPLNRYRSILFWPLADTAQNARAVDPDGPWREIKDRLRYLDAASGPAEAAQAYAELVYFHDYVQQALYGRGGGKSDRAGIRVFARDDIGSVTVEIRDDDLGARIVTLEVERLHLYRAGPDIAILVIEVAAGREKCVEKDGEARPLTLADAMTLADHFRRAYPPYFNDAGRPGLSPLSVQWNPKDADKARASAAQTITREAATAHVAARQVPPVFPHWLDLLPVSMIEGKGADRRLAARWRQLVDERMPNMTFLALRDEEGRPAPLETLSLADRARLAAVDAYGKKSPYSDAQMVRDLETQAYDRFENLGTLYLVSGYGFTAVGSGWYFENLAQTHFRRHYFQMGLMLQIEAASCLAVSGRVSRALRGGYRGEPERRVLIEAQKKLLELTHRYRFTGVSNHVQGRELFSLWRHMLGNDTLFKDLAQEMETGAAFLRAEKQERDGRIAGRFTVFGAAFGLLGIVSLMKPPEGADLALISCVAQGRHHLVALALAFGAGALSSLCLEWADRIPFRRWVSLLISVLVGALVLGSTLALPPIFGP